MPINRDLPVLRPGQPPPGRFEPDEDLREPARWRGPLGWLTRHGAGTLEWSLGRPVRAVGAVVPDGSEAGDVETLSPVHREVWRRPAPDGDGFQLGELSVSPDALAFAPVPRPPPTAGEADPDDPADMWADLAADPAFVAALADRAFADAVYDAFRGTDYRRADDPAAFSMSYRTAGACVAALRGRGEAYTDFYDWTPMAQPAMAARVRDAFLARRWHPVGPDEAADLRALAATLAETYGGRPPGPRPEWAPDDRVRAGTATTEIAAPAASTGESADEDADDEEDPVRALAWRVDALAWSGRVTRREWLALRSLAFCH